MKFCQAYGCEARASKHSTLCKRHFALASASFRVRVWACSRPIGRGNSTTEDRLRYLAAIDALVADVNRQLTPPAGAVAARPEPKGPAGSFAGSPFATPPPRNRVEEI